MTTYRAVFIGRRIGAIGAMQRFDVPVEATCELSAASLLYDQYQDVHALTLRPVSPEYPQEAQALREKTNPS